MSFSYNLDQVKLNAEAQKLSVLVWGSGQSSPQDYAKRVKIREELQKHFHNAEVRFSEDPQLRASIPGVEDLSIPEQELWHLAACDVCVVLNNSPGAAAEIAHFVRSKEAFKLFILTHENYKDSQSFPSMLREKANQVFYDNEAYEQCHLVERAVTRVRQVALGKLTGYRV
jgi:hypothetical protein